MGWLLLFLVAATSVGGWIGERNRRTAAEWTIRKQVQVNDSTAAKLASTRADRDTLQALFTAARALNGRLIAGFRINVPGRDTLVVHDTLVTTVVDSTRTASFKDSTFAGLIEGTVTAPPFPGALGLSYTLTRPSFSPSVGFVDVKGKTVAVVTWQGERFDIEAPFFKAPAGPRVRRLVVAGYDPLNANGFAGGAVTFRTFKGVHLVAGAGVTAGQPTQGYKATVQGTTIIGAAKIF